MHFVDPKSYYGTGRSCGWAAPVSPTLGAASVHAVSPRRADCFLVSSYFATNFRITWQTVSQFLTWQLHLRSTTIIISCSRFFEQATPAPGNRLTRLYRESRRILILAPRKSKSTSSSREDFVYPSPEPTMPADAELSSLLSRRQRINNELEEGKEVKKQYKFVNVYTEFHELSRREIKQYEQTFNRWVSCLSHRAHYRIAIEKY